MTNIHTNIKRGIGLALVVFGALGMIFLLFFYSTVLFSDKWPAFDRLNESFRILFDLSSGIVVIYASFITIFIPLFLICVLGIGLVFDKNYVSFKQALILAGIWIIAVFLGSVTTVNQVQKIIERIKPFSDDPVQFEVSNEIPQTTKIVFRTTLKNEVERTQGTPIEGYEPFMFLKAFPGLTETDFEGVEASIGHYTVKDGRLIHELDDSRLVHSAAGAVTSRGFDKLLSNVALRLNVNLSKNGTITEIMEALVLGSSGIPPLPKPVPVPVTPPPNEMIACTMDAKICPDGSAVGRQGPNCEFAPCP